MHEYTLKEVQETCDRLGARLRFLRSEEVTSAFSGRLPPLWTAILRLKGRVVAAQGESMDEAFGNAVSRLEGERRLRVVP
jgi:hypothetical protein